MGNWAVIMAGGVGKRFWPMSLQRKPKQFLALGGTQSLLEECLGRLLGFYAPDHIYIAASIEHKDAFSACLPQYPPEQIFWEPVGRNTAPCIGWVTEYIRRKDPQATIGVYPSDHAIAQGPEFVRSVERAHEQARGTMVLFGIEPTRAETGYGYIELGAQIPATNSTSFFKVQRFAEKPDEQTARRYMESGRYVWNGGIFIYDAQIMMEEFKEHQNELYQGIVRLCNEPERIAELFPQLASISIDYAVMEKTSRAIVQRVHFSWNDIGSWAAVQDLYPKDSQQNTVVGQALLQDCEEVFVFSTKDKLVAALGVKDLVIVNTPNAVLVTTAARAQEVRKLVETLEKSGKNELL